MSDRGQGSEPRGSSGAAAWGAAAVVVAIGALGFGVAGHVRADRLERRVEELEAGPTVESGVVSSIPSSVASPSPTSSAVAGPLEPTTPQPTTGAGAVGSRAAVEAVVEVAFDGEAAVAARLAAIDDPSGVEDGLQRLFAGEHGAFALSSRARVSEVSFTTESRAEIRYSLDGGGTTLGERMGQVRVVGGEWKLTRATICADLAAFDAPCTG